MQITHEEARRLIQFNADQPLRGTENKNLEDHLAFCLECREYAGKIRELETVLEAAMQRRWNRQPLPLSIQAAHPRRRVNFRQNIIFATRIAAMTVICVSFLFNIWQFNRSLENGPDPALVSAPPIPTPSIPSTSTIVWERGCAQTLYRVSENDTLESIASRFSVSPDEILSANRLEGEVLDPSMNLLIPLCQPTPGTSGTGITTFTPLLGSTTSTPRTSPTQ